MKNSNKMATFNPYSNRNSKRHILFNEMMKLMKLHSTAKQMVRCISLENLKTMHRNFKKTENEKFEAIVKSVFKSTAFPFFLSQHKSNFNEIPKSNLQSKKRIPMSKSELRHELKSREHEIQAFLQRKAA